MRLTKDTSSTAHTVSVQCFACGKMVRLSAAIIDLDGPAFKAYYHASCAPTDKPAQPDPMERKEDGGTR